jgi:hypothetical protein
MTSVGSARNLGRPHGALGIRDRIFCRKLVRFLAHVDVAEEDRLRFATELADPKERRRVGATILLILDRLDDLSKADVLGRAMKLYMEGKIDYALFRRVGRAIDAADIDDLRELAKSEEANQIPRDAFDRLVSTGLVRRSAVVSSHPPSKSQEALVITDLF